MPTCPLASLLSPQQPIWWAHQEEQGRRTEAPLPAASLVSRGIETGCLWEGGSFGVGLWGLDLCREAMSPTLLFLDPCSLLGVWVYVCVCACMCACVRVCVRVCVCVF